MWSAAALLIATTGVLYGNTRVGEAWHWCLTQDHEPDPRAAAAARSVWVLMFVALLVLGAVLSPLPHSSWYLVPAMLAVAAGLTWLYVTGMGSPAPSQVGEPMEASCRTAPSFPFRH
ncbi:hypothetical protein [Kitasatospora sp. NPDC051914]|uniref:hypothetical protein n=1 Tax=Kitasatospora sp. NPDC051914 TaxID=3154945 RepID=UPI003416D308